MEEINPWKTLQSDVKYDNNWIRVTEHQVINPTGGKGIYGEVHFKNLAIGILPLDEDYNTWLVGQYRYPIKAYSWEIPEGGGPFHEVPLDSARRELLEETGMSAQNWKEILRLHLSNSVSDELSIVYVATGLIKGIAMPEETEELMLKKLPFEAAYQMVLNGEITDSISVAAILKAKIMMQNGQL
ncbi:NUDIX domain-containing protein [Pedobacter soli]|uniref:8-oxo-dGTP pyrophosphatase MutT, NUDIX family n=1 Tax=Pedobacter soli TaxID=390242 RepID=A0A1G6U6I8_9SPHI|nr:NUDIX hydrolase [Pedobacter soli]SDD36207.1 8-oxo-dGTP pyrophosphatase MutT, NUDIX family [Pedobacter soli]